MYVYTFGLVDWLPSSVPTDRYGNFVIDCLITHIQISELGSSTPSGAKKEEKPDNPVFSPASVLALIKAIEIDTPNFGMQFGKLPVNIMQCLSQAN